MHRVTGSIAIAAPLAACFDAVSRPDLWPRFNPFCKDVTVLRSEGNATVFSFHHSAGDQWRSAQLASPEAGACFVDRLDPQPPVICFQILRFCRAASDGGTLLTEEVRIDLAAEREPNEEATRRIATHMAVVHQHLKEYLESHAHQAE